MGRRERTSGYIPESEKVESVKKRNKGIFSRLTLAAFSGVIPNLTMLDAINHADLGDVDAAARAFPPGAQVIEVDQNFVGIDYPDGGNGNPPIEQESEPVFVVGSYTTSYDSNVRGTASVNGSRVGFVEAGTKMNLLSTPEDYVWDANWVWAEVSYKDANGQDVTGWIAIGIPQSEAAGTFAKRGVIEVARFDPATPDPNKPGETEVGSTPTHDLLGGREPDPTKKPPVEEVTPEAPKALTEIEYPEWATDVLSTYNIECTSPEGETISVPITLRTSKELWNWQQHPSLSAEGWAELNPFLQEVCNSILALDEDLYLPSYSRPESASADGTNQVRTLIYDEEGNLSFSGGSGKVIRVGKDVLSKGIHLVMTDIPLEKTLAFGPDPDFEAGNLRGFYIDPSTRDGLVINFDLSNELKIHTEFSQEFVAAITAAFAPVYLATRTQSRLDSETEVNERGIPIVAEEVLESMLTGGTRNITKSPWAKLMANRDFFNSVFPQIQAADDYVSTNSW